MTRKRKYNTDKLDALIWEGVGYQVYERQALKLGLTKAYAKKYYYSVKGLFGGFQTPSKEKPYAPKRYDYNIVLNAYKDDISYKGFVERVQRECGIGSKYAKKLYYTILPIRVGLLGKDGKEKKVSGRPRKPDISKI